MTDSPTVQPPDGLTPDALDLFEDVVQERGADLTPERFAALVQACRLVSLADRAEAALGEAFLVDGYKGQPVANGLLSEVRLARSAAVAALKIAGLAPAVSAASAAGAALAHKRHHGRVRAVR